jgi:hypothetical protein
MGERQCGESAIKQLKSQLAAYRARKLQRHAYAAPVPDPAWEAGQVLSTAVLWAMGFRTSVYSDYLEYWLGLAVG